MSNQNKVLNLKDHQGIQLLHGRSNDTATLTPPLMWPSNHMPPQE